MFCHINTDTKRCSVVGVLFLVSFLFMTGSPGFSQEHSKEFYVIDNLESRELIKSVGKDHNGYLWVATDDGLIHFDGYTTKTYYSGHFAKGFLLTSNRQFYMFHDSGMSEIVGNLDSVEFQPVELTDKLSPNRMLYPKEAYEDNSGNIWIAEPQSLLRLNSDGTRRLPLDDTFRSIDYHKSFSFVEDAFKNLWIVAWKGHLLSYNKENQELIQMPLSKNLSKVTSIICVRGDYLLMGGVEGLLMVKVDSDKNILEEHFISGITGVSTMLAYDGHVYAGTWRDGLYRYKVGETNPSFERLNNVPFTDILDLYLDPINDELWVVSGEAVGLFKDTPVMTVPASTNLRIESLELDRNGGAYFTTGSEIFFVEDLNVNSVKVLAQSDETFFNDIRLEDKKLWIADAFGRIAQYNLEDGVLAGFSGRMSSQSHDLFIDTKGNKWLSRHRQGLVKVNSSGRKVYENLPRANFVRESPDGTIYVGKEGKETFLWQYNEKLDVFDSVDLHFRFDLPADISAIDIQFKKDGSALIATNDGLLNVFLDSDIKEVEKVNFPGLDGSGHINAVITLDDVICFASHQGLVIMNDDGYIILNQETGLPSKMIEDRGLSVDESGNIFVSTAKGIALVRNELIRFQKSHTPIVKSVTVSSRPVNKESGERVFKYGSRLDVEFGSLTFPADNVLYQTRIIGLDSAWSELSAIRNLNIISLPDGEYNLEVRAREDGRTLSNISRYPFTVGLPWYKTWSSIILFLSGAVAIVFVAAKLYNKRLIRQRSRLRIVISQHAEQIYQQKNEIISQQEKLIRQKEELISKNETVHQSRQALLEADKKYLKLKEKQLQTEIELKNKQITTHALNILQKNETLQTLVSQLREMVKKADKVSVIELKRTIKSIEDSFKLDKDWDSFRLYFEQIHTDFYPKLKVNYPELTPLELRHCALIRLNLSLAECATILGISPESIKVSRTRIRKKLNLNSSQNLSEFVLSF
jgi:AraC family transcriptional regulator, chitin signaling transcriptional activator